MKNIALILVLLSGFMSVATTPALADQSEGAQWAYASKDADGKLTETIAGKQDWAKGEYEEHNAEGLFKKYPADGQLILDMIAVSKELQEKAEAATKVGDVAKARAYNFSAEAAAQYAAGMPHMLEARVQAAGK